MVQYSRWMVPTFLGCAVLMLSGVAQAQSSSYKIGVVNVKEVFDSYERQTVEYARLQEERDTKQAEIDKLSEKISTARDRYEENKDEMSTDERRELEEQIESDYSLYKAEFKRLQEDIDRREKKLLESIFDEIHVAISEVGAKGNYHLVLEGGTASRSGVLYSSTTLNMTQQIIDHLNDQFSGS